MTATLRDALPEIYARLLPSFFDGADVVESKATCSACAMAVPEGAAPPTGIITFLRDTKCCTYHPRLPNYLVGALLADETPALAEGRARVRAKLGARIGVTPQWLAPPKKLEILLEAARGSSFGRSTSLRCPYFATDTGLCTIWRFREADCSTFFCKHDAGADGRDFWRALDAYLRVVERFLSLHAMRSASLNVKQPAGAERVLLLHELEDRKPPERDYAEWWGEWVGHEEAFYLACFEQVRALDRDALERIVEGHGERLAALDHARTRMAEPVLPERLVLASDLVRRRVAGEREIVTSYSRYDPTLLPTAALEALEEFGRAGSVEEARRVLASREVTLSDDLLITLWQLRVLVEPPAPRAK